MERRQGTFPGRGRISRRRYIHPIYKTFYDYLPACNPVSGSFARDPISCALKHYRGIRYLMAQNSDDQPLETPFNKTLFTYFLDTRFPVDVEIEEPILQGKTVFIWKGGGRKTCLSGKKGLVLGDDRSDNLKEG
jgi:hypothetical protein